MAFLLLDSPTSATTPMNEFPLLDLYPYYVILLSICPRLSTTAMTLTGKEVIAMLHKLTLMVAGFVLLGATAVLAAPPARDEGDD